MRAIVGLAILVVAVLSLQAAPTPARAQGTPEFEVEAVLRLSVAASSAEAGIKPGLAPAQPAVRPKSAEFTVTYIDVPGPAQTAFDHAAAIWEGLLVSKAETKVEVSWRQLAGDYLAVVRYRSNLKDGADDRHLPVPGVLYSSALANAFRGARVDSLPDMVVELDSDSPWYFGTDGLVPWDKVDLVTVALHEIGQGLGFSSRFELRGGTPAARAGYLSIFDTFLEDHKGQRLMALLGTNNAALATSIAGGTVVFNGASARIAGGGAPPLLYTPMEFEPGSSLAHLHETEYGPPNENRLLGPFLVRGWPAHDPGPIALAMLSDMGWTIAGLGEPARLKIDRIPAVAPGDGKTLLDIRVTVRDPIGAPVAGDNSTVVLLRAAGQATTTRGDCLGETSSTRVVSGGQTTFHKCFVGGYGLAFFRADAQGLASGASNAILYARASRPLPMLGRDR